jgi:flagellin-like hook-associated protein FlgL
MSILMIGDLAQSRELDRQAMSTVRGGQSWFSGMGSDPKFNINVGVFQDQKINVAVLNNSKVGAGFKFEMDFSPTLSADLGG